MRLHDEQARSGQGEASPLPGYSSDDLESCRLELERFTSRPFELDDTLPIRELLAVATQALPASCPAARFALETAILDLIGQQRAEPAWALLRATRDLAAPVPTLLPLAALIDADGVETALTLGRTALERGVTTLKLKLGRPACLALELDIARALRAEFGKAFRLRLDANRSLSATQAALALDALTPLNPEFVEEPTPDLQELVGSPVPLALDESLQRPHELERLASHVERLKLRTLVLKPMALGLVRCLDLAAAARVLGLNVVVSHLFDGPIALASAAALALATASPDSAVGLDRHPGLGAWPELSTPMISPAHVLCLGKPGLGLEPLELALA